MQAVLPNLYISSWYIITGEGVLKSEGITHVLSVMKNVTDSPALSPFNRLVIDVNDDPDEDLIDYFQASAQWIEDSVAEGGKVLVHWFVPTIYTLLIVAWRVNRGARLSLLRI